MIDVIEQIILWTGFGVGIALCLKMARQYYLQIKKGLLHPKKAIKKYSVVVLLSPMATISWVFGFVFLGRLLGIDLLYSEKTGWAFLTLPFSVFAVAILGVGIFALRVQDLD